MLEWLAAMAASPHTDDPIVEVENPSDGGFFHWLLKFYAFGALCMFGLALCIGVGVYLHFAATLPRLPDFAGYQQQAVTTSMIRGWDGTPLAELSSEEREILPFEKIPRQLIAAFLAAEDRRFYEHGGLDYRGIVRAVGANLRAGEVAQGGSTITQQVAKSFLSSERTIQRKIREAILARRLETRYRKDEILALYLNQIFLGNGAYGVAAAARRYFDKTVDELDAGEMATLAGLARAPSRFSPLAGIEHARARRDQVLEAMVQTGALSEADATAARARPLTVHPRPNFFLDISPYFTEHVRMDIAKRYGEDALLKKGLQVETTLLPWIDAAAQENVEFSTRKLDKRQGWHGPVSRLRPAQMEGFRARSARLYGGDPPAEGRVYLGLVEAVNGGVPQVRVGKNVYPVSPDSMTWAVPFSLTDSTNDRKLGSTSNVLHAGDVVWVRNAHRSRLRRWSDWTYDEKGEVQWMPAHDGKKSPKTVTLALEQRPTNVQAALFSYDHGSGYVLAMAGGNDFEIWKKNRIVDRRQPGSSYKPVYYSLALDKGYGFASLLNDVPRAEVDPITGEVWIPTNLNNTVEYQVTLEYALIWSKNVPSVQLFKLVGGKEVEAWARRLGYTTEIIPDQALALGASYVYLDEMTRAFSPFARNGLLIEPVYVRRVRDRNGRVLEDNSSIDDPCGSPSERLDRLVAVAGKKQEPVISPRTAWLTSQLLRRVVTKGHAPAIRSAQLLAAGKTGTSSKTYDTWFVGYTSRWMTTAWIGDVNDARHRRPLGYKDAAYMLTVPMFARYMKEVTASQPLQEIPWQRPAGVRANDTGGTLRTTMAEVVADGPGGRPAKTPPQAPKKP